MDNGIMHRILAGGLVMGLALGGPGMPAFAQVEITPEIRQACEAFEPALRDIALTEIVPKLEESTRPDASEQAKQEAKTVEATATAIRETTETAKQAVANPEAMAKQAVETLAKHGVPTEVATRVEAQMKDALAKARETLNSGGTLDDAAKYFETAKSAMAECSGYLGGKDFKEVFGASGPAGSERQFRSMEFVGTVMDAKTGDTMDAAMKAHFEGTVKDAMLRGSAEAMGPSPEMMRTAMEQMVACGINPRDVMEGAFRGGPEMAGGPPKEMLETMTPDQRAGYEAWKSGDHTAVMEMAINDSMKAAMEAGMTPEQRATMETHMHDMATMEVIYRDATVTSPMQDAPRTETSGTSVTNYENRYPDGHALCPEGKTHVPGAADGPGHCA